jgi:S-adenosylmethionine synthetase
VRKSGELSCLRPDCKSQVSVRYVNGKPAAIDAVVLSTQHDEQIGYDDLKEAVMETRLRPCAPPPGCKGAGRRLVRRSFGSADPARSHRIR